MIERETEISSYCYELGVLNYLLIRHYITQEEYDRKIAELMG